MNYNSTPKCHLQILVKLPSINIIPLFITPTDFPVNKRLSKGEFDDFDLNLVLSTVQTASISNIVKFTTSPCLISGIGRLRIFRGFIANFSIICSSDKTFYDKVL